MFRVVLADGSILEVPSVARAEVKENCLICYNEQGAVLQKYGSREVIAYGDDGSILAMIESGHLAELMPEHDSANS
jgi:hypothetical protein